MSPAARPLKRSPRLRMQWVLGEGVVVIVDSAEALVLNATGYRILELADGSRSEEQIVALLAGKFDASPGEITAALREFLASKDAEGLFVEEGGSGG